MKNTILVGLIITATIILTLVSYHSIEEIHYLKSFFPYNFTVEEAMQASIIELIKICLLAIPLTLIIIICLWFIKREKKR